MKKESVVLLSSLMLGIIYTLYAIQCKLNIVFFVFVVLTYLTILPKKLMDPKNFVFFFYFLWYVMAPNFASRYENVYFMFGEIVDFAYLICFTSYEISMITLHLTSLSKNKSKTLENRISNFGIRKGILICLIICFLSVFVQKTGGILNWLSNPNAAFYHRRGFGAFYLGFEYSLMLFLFFSNTNSRMLHKFICVVILCCLYIFINSKGAMMLLLLMIFNDEILSLKIFSKKSFVLIITGIFVFGCGMYLRVGHRYMYDFSSVLSTSLNYFDTFDNLLMSLRDFPPSFGKTFLLPFNFLLLKIGTYISLPYHDMSIWLTTIYVPESWINGGTWQWPIETDMYLSFHYFLGIPLLVFYFVLIAVCYRKARKSIIWRFIYIHEALAILSHLRGGLLIYWYLYLIPLYCLLFIIFDKKLNLIFFNYHFRQGNIK